ncbi:MAG: terminase small subunit [Desulfobacterales bacterium]
MAKKLTHNQKLFISEYLKDRNATRAYFAAYPNVKSESAARVNASRLLTNANVGDAISDALKAQEKRTQISADKALREIARIGFSDIRKLFDENGDLKSIAELDDDIAGAISSIDVATKMDGEQSVRIVKIKFWDKNAALEKLAKHFKLFADKVEHSVDDGLTRLLRELDGQTRQLPKLTAKT